MAVPTTKAKEIDNLISKIAGKDRVETIYNDKCMTCDSTDLTFRDELSVEEYKISGMCQKCQDKTFGP